MTATSPIAVDDRADRGAGRQAGIRETPAAVSGEDSPHEVAEISSESSSEARARLRLLMRVGPGESARACGVQSCPLAPEQRPPHGPDR